MTALQANHSSSLRRSVVISSEDPQSVEFFQDRAPLHAKLHPAERWEVMATTTPRNPDSYIGSQKISSTLEQAYLVGGWHDSHGSRQKV